MISLQIDTQIIFPDMDHSFKTLNSFEEFMEKTRLLQSNNNYLYEFLDDFGEKVKLTNQNYFTFLNSSDGFTNYIYAKIDFENPHPNPNPSNIAIKPWVCKYCQCKAISPDLLNCPICTKVKY